MLQRSDSRKTIWFPSIPRESSVSRRTVMQASRLSAWKIPCSPFSVNLFCSLQFPTTMSGPDLPGPSWRFVRTELTARRKAPLSYLPSGNEPSPPWPSRAQYLQSSSPLVFSVHSVSVLPWPFGCHVVPALLQVFQMYTVHWPEIHQSISIFIFLSQKWGWGGRSLLALSCCLLTT